MRTANLLQKIEIVDELPSSHEAGTLYLVSGVDGFTAFVAGRDGESDYINSHNDLNLSADDGSTLVGFISPGSGAVPRTVYAKIKERYVSISDFGAIGDNSTDDGPAITAAIAYLKTAAVNNDAGFYKASLPLYIPPGKGYLGTTTLDITNTLTIEGESTGQAGGRASILRWAANATGIRIQRYNTSGASTIDDPTHFGGDSSIIRGLDIEGGYAGTEGEYHGIDAKARVLVENCAISSFQGDGFHGSSDTGGNLNNSIIRHCRIGGNRDGVRLYGGDANVIHLDDVDMSSNRRWGYNGEDFLQALLSSCHAADNGLIANTTPTVVSYLGNRFCVKDGQDIAASTNAPAATGIDNSYWLYISAGAASAPLNIPTWTSGPAVRAGGAYRTASNNSYSLLECCYSESGQGASQLVYPTIALNGQHGAPVKGTGVWVRNRLGGITTDSGWYTLGSSGNSASVSPDNGLTMTHPTYGSRHFIWTAQGDLALATLNDLTGATWAYRLTGETTSVEIGARRIDFLNGYGMSTTIHKVGTGSPEGVLTGKIGSTFRRTDGGAGTVFYVKESGTGNTGWVGK